MHGAYEWMLPRGVADITWSRQRDLLSGPMHDALWAPAASRLSSRGPMIASSSISEPEPLTSPTKLATATRLFPV